VGRLITEPESELSLRRRAPLRELPRRLWRDLTALPPWRVAFLVSIVYGALVLAPVVQGRAGDFAFVGHRYLDRSATPASIADHAHATSRDGYDGQFALFIALDPAHAAPSIDKPAYRYTHILYPALSRALALGHDAWVPVAMLLVNLLAVFSGTLALALVLKRSHEPPALAAVFGLFPGMFVAFERDLGDVLAYSLVPVAVLAMRWDRWSRLVLAGLVFAAAGLARESTLFFPAVLALWHLIQPGHRPIRALQATVLVVLAAAPYVGWKLFLLSWLGRSHSVPSGLASFPFQGILFGRSWGFAAVFEALVVVLPGLLLAFAALGALRGRTTSPFVVVVLVQVLVFVIFLPPACYADYDAAGRLQLGAVLGALCSVPALRGLADRFRTSLRAAIALAMLPALLFSVAVLLSGAA
jgi:hypothetical protein